MERASHRTRRRTLRRTIVQQIGAMIVGMLLVGVVAVYGLNGLRSDFGVALAGYRELREVYDIGLHVATAKKAMNGQAPDPARATNELDAAIAKLDRYLAGPATAGSASLAQSDEGRRLTTALRASLRAAVINLHTPVDDAFQPAVDQRAEIDRAMGQVAAIGAEIQRIITAGEAAARTKWRTALTLVSVVAIAAVCGAVLLSVFQYRSVITPLSRLRSAAGNIAAGQFSDRVQPSGFSEFNELADDFNRMAAELQSLYRDLEQKVATKSVELARAQRLASVGFLAAGVAHEINNPLSIITGYGERALRHIELEDGEPMLAAVEKCLRIVCDEAYRCKSITDQLLTMARSGNELRKPLDLIEVARQVVAAVSVVPEYQNRRITIVPSPSPVTVVASETELKQALMNLIVNACEAVPSQTGQITIACEQVDGVARLRLSDNGRGMSKQTLERIFEPFYTEKRGSNRAGTGLGLSITQAIVQSHGGTLQALSEGPGKGSQLIMELPIGQTGGAT